MDFTDPITLKGLEQLTDDAFFEFCQQNQDLRIERTRSGEIIIMSPKGSRTGLRNSEINRQLANWNSRHRLGYVFAPSTGFTLPDGSGRSPDAAWVSRAAWEALAQDEQEKFAPVCPGFIIELKSPADPLPVVQDKMETWMANGCRLAWLIYPEVETVFIYYADGRRDELHGFGRRVSGEDVLPGFELELDVLR